MGSKFFEIEKKEKKRAEVSTEETYGEDFFKVGKGYDPSAQTVDPYEEETTTFSYAAPSGFDPSRIGAPDEKNYISNEEADEMEQQESNNSFSFGYDPSKVGAPDEKNYVSNEEDVSEEQSAVKEEESNESPEVEVKKVADFQPFAAAGEAEPEYANPVYKEEEKKAEEEKIEDININVLSIIKMMIGSVIKPGTSVPKYAKGIDGLVDAIKAVVHTVLFVLALSFIVSIVTGGFVKTFDINTGAYTTVVDFGNIANIKLVDIILTTLGVSIVSILLIGFVYYLTSFFKSKGVALEKYLVISNFALLPMLISIFVLFPILSIISYYVSFFVLILGVIVSIYSLFHGVSVILNIEDDNKKIFYNLFNLGVVLLICFVIMGVFFPNDFNSVINIINEM